VASACFGKGAVTLPVVPPSIAMILSSGRQSAAGGRF
jgi:hypothetical protein